MSGLPIGASVVRFSVELDELGKVDVGSEIGLNGFNLGLEPVAGELAAPHGVKAAAEIGYKSVCARCIPFAY